VYAKLFVSQQLQNITTVQILDYLKYIISVKHNYLLVVNYAYSIMVVSDRNYIF